MQWRQLCGMTSRITSNSPVLFRLIKIKHQKPCITGILHRSSVYLPHNRASNVEKVFKSWRHHGVLCTGYPIICIGAIVIRCDQELCKPILHFTPQAQWLYTNLSDMCHLWQDIISCDRNMLIFQLKRSEQNGRCFADGLYECLFIRPECCLSQTYLNKLRNVHYDVVKTSLKHTFVI